jgi:hypothetical protein
MLVIGSLALKIRGLSDREPNDLDFVATYEDSLEIRESVLPTSFYPINGGDSMCMRLRDGRMCEVELA